MPDVGPTQSYSTGGAPTNPDLLMGGPCRKCGFNHAPGTDCGHAPPQPTPPDGDAALGEALVAHADSKAHFPGRPAQGCCVTAGWDAAHAYMSGMMQLHALQAERERSEALRKLLFDEHVRRVRGDHQREVRLQRYTYDGECEACRALARTEEP